MLRTRAMRMTSRRMLDLEAELKPLLVRAIEGAASTQETERIETIFALCRQANKLEQYRVWRAQMRAQLAEDITEH